MQIPTDAKSLYTRYVETAAQLSVLTKEKDELKSAIIARLGGERFCAEDGFIIKLTPGVRKTANAALIESNLGVKLTDSCYKITSYDSLSVVPVKA